MLQSSCLPFVLYASQRIACYFCTMKRFLLITIAAIFCSSATVCAQFNTVTQTKVHRKAVPKTTQSATSEQLPPCSPHQRRDSLAFAPLQTQTEQTDRHTALVSPLRHISVTSPFGYRRDPFTKRKALHNGLDLKANYEPTYAMMHGEVIKVRTNVQASMSPSVTATSPSAIATSPKLSSPKAPTSVPASSSR